MTTAALTFTDLLRTPKDVVARTDEGAVRITRHGADDLVLLRADDFDQQQQGVALAGKLVRARLAHDGNLGGALVAEFPWAALFSPGELAEFASQVERLLWAAVELGHYAALMLEFARWRGTAEVYADGYAPRDVNDLDWLEQPVDVPRPV
jgi:prevent-host-death family protein